MVLAQNSAEGSSSARASRGFSRELVLVVCFLCLIVLLGVTAFVSRMYHRRVHSLADHWFEQGETAFKSGDAKKALMDYRNALAFSPSNKMFQFHLALALAADNQLPEARAYLLPLLSDAPGSGEINLALARIAAKQSKMQDAMLYYNGAIYGEWDTQPIEMRWNVRKELCDFLLDSGAIMQAEPALIALADSTPEGDLGKEKTVASMLLKGQLWSRALDEFKAVLQSDRGNPDALQGAGVASFQLGDYARAVSYLSRLPKDQPVDPQVAAMLQTARQIESTNPFLTGLSVNEKAHRAFTALSLAEARAQSCIAHSAQSGAPASASADLSRHLASAQDQERNWSERNLARFPDRVDDAMTLVFRIENSAARLCGDPTGADQAIWIIGHNMGYTQP